MTVDQVALYPLYESPCLARLTLSRVWQPTKAFRIARHVLGIRANSQEASARVAQALAPYRAPEWDAAARPNFSVELSPAAPSGARRLQLVYRNHTIVARRRDEQALLQDLVDLVTATGHPTTSDGLAVRATGLRLADGSLALLPVEWHRTLMLHSGALRQRSMEVLSADSHVLAQGTRGAPLRIWCVTTAGQTDRPLAGAQAVQSLFFSVVNMGVRGPGSVLRDLAAACGATHVVGLARRHGREQLDAVQALV